MKKNIIILTFIFRLNSRLMRQKVDFACQYTCFPSRWQSYMTLPCDRFHSLLLLQRSLCCCGCLDWIGLAIWGVRGNESMWDLKWGTWVEDMLLVKEIQFNQLKLLHWNVSHFTDIGVEFGFCNNINVIIQWFLHVLRIGLV